MNILKNLLDQPQRIFGPHLFENVDVQDPRTSKHISFQKRFGISCIFVNSLVTPKSRIIGCGSHGRVHEVQHNEYEDFSDF